MNEEQKSFQKTISLICQVLQIKKWNVQVKWMKNEESKASSHIFVIDPDAHECTLTINETWLSDEEKAVMLLSIVTERLVEIATYELQMAVEQQKAILKKIIKGVALPLS